MIRFYFSPYVKRRMPIRAKRLVNKSKYKLVIYKIIVVLLILSIISVLCDIKLRPIIQTVGGNALKNTLSNVLDGTVNEMVDSLGVKYSDMVNIEKNNYITLMNNNLENLKIELYK